MTPEPISRMEAIFHAARRLPPAQRSAFLDGQCQSDLGLRHEVESLLAEDSNSAPFLDESRIPLGRLVDSPAEYPAPLGALDRIGHYRIVGLLGEGGMGVVYEAEQEHPRRRVALKVLRLAGASPKVLRRFVHETQVLGRLQHPGVAQIYEAGTADSAHGPLPFFAMEMVRGCSLTEYARRRHLDTRARLELFTKVCDAVQHAHQHGVIHRDLKPANIHVVDDGVPQPKVLDFGVARAAHPDQDTAHPHTRTGQLIGTLPYMSPEQFVGNCYDVDTRSDVYSLGVILFELLAERLPYAFVNSSIPETIRIVREEEPCRLSTLSRHFRGDVDTIAYKSLEKDKSRRYQSAAELADDIRRFLAGQPIVARQDSAMYLLRKKLRRWRVGLAVATAFMLLVSGFGGAMYLKSVQMQKLAEGERQSRRLAEFAWAQAKLAEHQAQRQRDEAASARDAESAERRLAEQQTDRARSVTAFLVDTLGLADPDITQTPDRTLQTMLNRASAAVSAAFAGQPESEATVRLVIGRAYASLGELDPAYLHLQRALELREKETPVRPDAVYEVLGPYTQVLEDLGDFEWRRRWRQLWRLIPDVVRPVQTEMAEGMKRLAIQMNAAYDANKIESMYEALMQSARAGLTADDPHWLVFAEYLYLSGADLGRRGSLEPGSRFLLDALTIQRRFLPETHTSIVRTLGALITQMIGNGRYKEAETLARQSLELIARSLPEDHWYSAVYRARLGACLTGLGRFPEAESLLLENYPRIVLARGENNVYAREVIVHLVNLYDAWGMSDKAARQRWSLAAALAGTDQAFNPIGLRESFGPEHAELWAAFDCMKSEVSNRTKEIPSALRHLFEVRRRLVPDDHPLSAVIAEYLMMWGSQCFGNTGVDENSLAMFQEAERLARTSHFLNPWKFAGIIFDLAWALQVRERFDEAEPLAREALSILESQFGNRDLFALNARNLLGAILYGQGHCTEAEPMLIQSYQELLASLGPTDRNTLNALDRLTDSYIHCGQVEKAANQLRQLLDQGASTKPLDEASWQIAKHPGLSEDSYLVALAAAQHAVSKEPEDGYVLNTLGVVQYRLGRYADAIQTLTRSNELSRGENYADIVFLSMAHARLGHADEARNQLQIMRGLRPTAGQSGYAQASDLLREAEAVVSSP